VISPLLNLPVPVVNEHVNRNIVDGIHHVQSMIASVYPHVPASAYMIPLLSILINVENQHAGRTYTVSTPLILDATQILIGLQAPQLYQTPRSMISFEKAVATRGLANLNVTPTFDSTQWSSWWGSILVVGTGLPESGSILLSVLTYLVACVKKSPQAQAPGVALQDVLNHVNEARPAP
jgi:hypothetical protein